MERVGPSAHGINAQPHHRLPGQTPAPLSSGAREWGGLVGEHGSVDDVGEPAFEDAEGFHTAVAVVFAPVEQFTLVGRAVLGQCNAV